MKECSYCGMLCKDSATVCKACGTPLSKAETQIPASKTSAAANGSAPRSVPHTQPIWEACDAIDYLKKATVHIFVLCLDEENGLAHSSGTGFFITYNEKTYLITNHHVIAGALPECGSITVKFSKEISPREDALTAIILASDQLNDVALLEVVMPIPKDVVCLTLADLSTVRAGEKVVTVGCPRHMEFNSVEGAVSNTCVRDNPFAMTQILCTLLTTNGNSGGAVIRQRDLAVVGLVTGGFFGDYMPGHTVCTSADAIRQLIHAYERGI